MSTQAEKAYDRVSAHFEQARAALAHELAERVPRPIDTLEIAAVIESIGITDAVAEEDYGVASSFDLAELVFPLVHHHASERFFVDHEPDDPQILQREAESTRLDASVRGVLALVPLALLLIALHALAAAGWSSSLVLSLGLGVTAAMVLTSGPLVAIGRRTSIYIGFGYRTSARRFLILSSLVTFIACAVIAAAILGVSSALGLFDPSQRWIFAVSLLGYALLWLLAAGVLMAGFPIRVIASLITGLVVGFAVGTEVGSAAAGLGVGYAVSIGALTVSFATAYRLTDHTRALRLPSAGLASLEAAPYVAFGSLFALLLLEPHVLGWLGQSDQDQLSILATLELSFTLALPPILLASGAHEHTMHSFWVFVRVCQRTCDQRIFSRRVAAFHWREFRRYAAVLGALSVAMVIGCELVFLSGGLADLSQIVFLCAIAGFFLLGLGQFNCLLMLSLAPPRRAIESLLAGVVVLSVLGIPLAFVDFRLAALGFALGAGAFAAAAVWNCRGMLGEVDYYYATAF